MKSRLLHADTGGVISPDTGGSLSKDGDNLEEFVSKVMDIKANTKPVS